MLNREFSYEVDIDKYIYSETYKPIIMYFKKKFMTDSHDKKEVNVKQKNVMKSLVN